MVVGYGGWCGGWCVLGGGCTCPPVLCVSCAELTRQLVDISLSYRCAEAGTGRGGEVTASRVPHIIGEVTVTVLGTSHNREVTASGNLNH